MAEDPNKTELRRSFTVVERPLPRMEVHLVVASAMSSPPLSTIEDLSQGTARPSAITVETYRRRDAARIGQSVRSRPAV